MGLGDIKVTSYLDQPFSADIELIDVGNIPLSGIKVNLASAEDFERMGLERAYALSLLIFNVEKHANGKAFIKVSSIERITDPFMQVLVDLAWAEGQVYRAYTVLLDPPNYQLSVVKHQLNNIVKRQYDRQPSKQGAAKHETSTQIERAPVGDTGSEYRGTATYGPTLANETIWQIAQHYKTGDVSLQQIILAIVGTNPQSFTEGNLNGLKDASRLQIPANSAIDRVPVALARLEVLAHDKAWQTRAPIVHALMPPYIDTAAPAASGNESQVVPVVRMADRSEIPTAPAFSASAAVTPVQRFLPLMSSLLSVGEDAAVSNGVSKNKSAVTQQARVNADMDIAAAAIASVREVNAVLVEQLRTLQTENKRLQQKLTARNQEMQQLRNKVNVLLERQGVLGQVSKQHLDTEKNSILPWFLLLLVLGGCGFFYWTFWIRPKRAHLEEVAAASETPSLEPTPSPEPTTSQESAPSPEPTTSQEPAPSQEPITSQLIEDEPVVANEPVEQVVVNTIDASPIEPPLQEAETESDSIPALETISPAPVEVIEEPVAAPIEEEDPPQQETPVDEKEQVIEFEPGLLPPTESPEEDRSVSDEIDDNSIEFVLNPVEDVPPPEEKTQPVKSKAALETLLGLAKTYIGMDDIESAKQSLQEVLEFGNEKQKAAAKSLLDELDKK